MNTGQTSEDRLRADLNSAIYCLEDIRDSAQRRADILRETSLLRAAQIQHWVNKINTTLELIRKP